MNLCFFFEGTGQGVSGNVTNVTRLHDVCIVSERQKLRIEAGPGTHFGAYLRGLLHGHDWWLVFRGARRWFEKNRHAHPPSTQPLKVYVFGFSRGALIARHFTAWLDKLGVEVAYLGLWDTVDATLGLDVSEECPPNVRYARHALARDEKRRFYEYIPLRPSKAPGWPGTVEELVFPGTHSDVGGLYADNHVVADLTLGWIAQGAQACGLLVRQEELPKVTADRLETAVLHDSSNEATNLWGVLGGVRRELKGLKRHFSCNLIPSERYGKDT